MMSVAGALVGYVQSREGGQQYLNEQLQQTGIEVRDF